MASRRRIPLRSDALVVALLTLVCFLPALGNGFVAWDDDTNFLDNPHYRGLGPAQIAWMFTDFHAHYMPLTWLTLGLDYVLWGMNPAGYHLTSVLLHAANAALFFLVALRLLGAALPAAPDTTLRWGSLLAALLFAVHPLRVESVAWVTERRDVLCGLFYLLALLAYLRSCESGGRRAHLASLALFTAALLSKSMAVTLPVVLVLLDAWPLRRHAWREKVPFFALSAAAGALALVAQRQVGAISSAGLLGPLARGAVACYSLVFYLRKTLLPARLSPIYELPARVEGDPVTWSYILSVGVVVVLSAAAIALRRRWPAFSVTWVAYVVTVLPVSGLVHVGPQIAADRYTYLPCLGLALLAGGAYVRSRMALRGLGMSGGLLDVVAGTLPLVLLVLTMGQITVWRDTETLWSHALAAGPSAIAHAKLGVVRDEQGRAEEAIAHYRAALALHPDMPDAYNDWGIALARQGRWDDAVEQYRKALGLRPGSVEAHLNLATALERLGKSGEAAEHAREARRIQTKGR